MDGASESGRLPELAAEHGLKSSLTTILGWADLLCDQWDDMTLADRKKAATAIRNASLNANTRLDELIDEMTHLVNNR